MSSRLKVEVMYKLKDNDSHYFLYYDFILEDGGSIEKTVKRFVIKHLKNTNCEYWTIKDVVQISRLDEGKCAGCHYDKPSQIDHMDIDGCLNQNNNK